MDLNKLLENPDPSLRKEAEAEGCKDEFVKVFSVLAPKLWYLMMQVIPTTTPSTLVTSIISATAYMSVLPKEGSQDVDLYKTALIDSFANALDEAFEQDGLSKLLPQLASVGQLDLYRDLNNENTLILKRVANLLENFD